MRGRMGTRYEFLGELATPVEPAAGHSNYFSEVQSEHDPRLFEEGSDTVRPEIRLDLLNALYSFWEVKYSAPREWSTAWIAGSALGSQWSTDKNGKGDLDVLIGVDMPVFFKHHPHLRQFPEATIARHMNTQLREELWPAMEDYRGSFEVTFYVNPKTSTDIRNINPYAAYNLNTAAWDVRPVDLPESWGEEHIPEEWKRSVNAEIDRARTMIERYNSIGRSVSAAPEGPRKVTLLNELGQVIAQISDLYEDIHSQRRMAFQGRFGVKGQGFLDYYNFRWQMHKRAGTGPTMNQIKGIGKSVDEQHAIARYGSPPATDVLTPVTLKDYL